MVRCLSAAALVWTMVGSVEAQTVPAAGDTIEIVDYTVVEGDTCPSIARRLFGDRRRYDVLHAYNPEMGRRPTTSFRAPCCACRAPCPRRSPTRA